jgi:hypothetical protein
VFSPATQAALDRLAEYRGQFVEMTNGIRHMEKADRDGWYACPLCVLCGCEVSNANIGFIALRLEMSREETKEFMAAADRSADYDPLLRKAITDALGLPA